MMGPASISVTTLTNSGRENLKVVLVHSQFRSENPYKGSNCHGFEIFGQVFIIYL